VLDADIRGFFDTINREWMLRFLQHRIGDQRVIRLIGKWSKAGILEQGEWKASEEGTPQGATISPLLANVYMHYVFDLWIEQWRKRQARGEVVVRYADDFIVGFQHRSDAERFRVELKERLAKFALLLSEEKTRLIEFDRYANERYVLSGWGGIRTLGTNVRRPLDSILVQATGDKHLSNGGWKLVDTFGCYH
jgi:retron-type reverse transcriptase